MCGYCMEDVYALDFASEPYMPRELDLDAFNIPQYLQEHFDLAEALQEAGRVGSSPDLVVIARCRMYERFLRDGFDPKAWDVASAAFGSVTAEAHLETDAFGPWADIGRRLLARDVCSSQQAWNACISDSSQLLAASGRCLEAYIAWWIDGAEPRPSASAAGLRLAEVTDPTENTPAAERDRFHRRFPCVFFSLCVLAAHGERWDLVLRVALDTPDGVPDFAANDLWLQRTALIACIRRFGFDFARRHVSKLREELVYYVLLRCPAGKRELQRLRAAVQAEGARNTQYSTDPIVELIGELEA